MWDDSEMIGLDGEQSLKSHSTPKCRKNILIVDLQFHAYSVMAMNVRWLGHTLTMLWTSNSCTSSKGWWENCTLAQHHAILASSRPDPTCPKQNGDLHGFTCLPSLSQDDAIIPWSFKILVNATKLWIAWKGGNCWKGGQSQALTLTTCLSKNCCCIYQECRFPVVPPHVNLPKCDVFGLILSCEHACTKIVSNPQIGIIFQILQSHII